MKVPDVLFISHCPNLSPERKEFLGPYLKERVDIKDIRYFEDYNHDHPFVEWLHYVKKPPFGPKLLSCIVKMWYKCKTMVDENIESALFMDDDVVFIKNWREILESVEIENALFINLGTPYSETLAKPMKNTIYQLGNNGGCEVCYVSLQFAKLLLTHFSFLHAPDTVAFGILVEVKYPLLCVPIGFQTSGVCKSTTLDQHTNSNTMQDWKYIVNNYSTLKHENFYTLLDEYELYTELKKKKEDKFYEVYGKKVNIRSVEYVLNNLNNILEYD